MNHQITLEELGIIPSQIEKKSESKVDHSKYACPCGGCICGHCSNNVDCMDKCIGESDFGCFNCDDCRCYSGNGTYNWKSECDKYKITESYAQWKRKKFKIININRRNE